MKNVIEKSRGFSLVEVTLALGIAAFALLAIFGLIPVGLTSNQNSVNQTSASDLATLIVADLRNTPLPTPTVSNPISPTFKMSIPATGSVTHTLYFGANGKLTGAVDSTPQASTQPLYRAMIEISADQMAGTSSTTAATDVHLLITWPSQGSLTPIGYPKNNTGMFETAIAINRH